jgi:hypothetical protein
MFVIGQHGSGWIGRIELMELVFLVDFEAYRRLGRTITGVTYHQHHFGPLSWEVLDTAGQMPDIGVRQWTTDKRHPAHAYSLTTPSHGIPLAALSGDERAVVEDVCAEWGEEWWENTLEHVHGLPFVAQFGRGEEVDWDWFVEADDLAMSDEDRESAERCLQGLRQAAAQTAGARRDLPCQHPAEGVYEEVRTFGDLQLAASA